MIKRLSLLLLFTAIFLIKPSDTSAAKRIEINLNNQQLYAYEDGKLMHNFTISSGKPWWPTPIGTFKPRIKLSSTRMVGGDKRFGTYYNLPGVPYVVYFHKGYAIHGTYWHNNFGRPMSHGCVNLRTPDAQKIYNWIDLDTSINIYGVTPA